MGSNAPLALHDPQAEIPTTPSIGLLDSPDEPKEVTGKLLFADATSTNKIRLTDGAGKSPVIIVPEGMMDDIVRPM